MTRNKKRIVFLIIEYTHKTMNTSLLSSVFICSSVFFVVVRNTRKNPFQKEPILMTQQNGFGIIILISCIEGKKYLLFPISTPVQKENKQKKRKHLNKQT